MDKDKLLTEFGKLVYRNKEYEAAFDLFEKENFHNSTKDNGLLIIYKL